MEINCLFADNWFLNRRLRTVTGLTRIFITSSLFICYLTICDH